MNRSTIYACIAFLSFANAISDLLGMEWAEMVNDLFITMLAWQLYGFAHRDEIRK